VPRRSIVGGRGDDGVDVFPKVSVERALFRSMVDAVPRHAGAMRTFRLVDPAPQSTPSGRLPFGSSAWAKDSCLADWSMLEREWNEMSTPGADRKGARRLATPSIPPFLLLCMLLLASGLAALVWSVVKTLSD
jgi:hypothetical protein